MLWGHGFGSIGTAVWLGLVGLLVLAQPRTRDRLQVLAVIAAGVFATYLALRASSWLIPLNLLATFGLIAFAAVIPADRAVLQRPAMVICRYIGLFRLVEAAQWVLRPVDRLIAAQDRSRLRSVGIGLAIAVPVVFVLGSLLAAGDAVFSAALTQIDVFDNAAMTAFYMALGMTVTTTLMLATSRTWSSPTEPSRQFGATEASIIAGSVALLYSAFAISQAVATFGGVDPVLETAGLTRAEYARSGFFQLLYAAGLTLAVLLVLDRVRQPGHDRTFRSFAVVSSLLTVLVVAVSIDRLLTYVDDFGWTMLRLYTVLFAAWIGLLFVGLAFRFAGLTTLRTWYPVFVAVTGLIWLLGLNILNPEAFVARENLATPEHTDASYLVQLSPDATPEIVEQLVTLSTEDRRLLIDHLCTDEDSSWLGNIGRARGHDAIAPRC